MSLVVSANITLAIAHPAIDRGDTELTAVANFENFERNYQYPENFPESVKKSQRKDFFLITSYGKDVFDDRFKIILPSTLMKENLLQWSVRALAVVMRQKTPQQTLLSQIEQFNNLKSDERLNLITNGEITEGNREITKRNEEIIKGNDGQVSKFPLKPGKDNDTDNGKHNH